MTIFFKHFLFSWLIYFFLFCRFFSECIFFLWPYFLDYSKIRPETENSIKIKLNGLKFVKFKNLTKPTLPFFFIFNGMRTVLALQ